MDAFMVGNEAEKKQQARIALRRQKATVEAAETRVRKLLKVAAPALSGLRAKGGGDQ